MNTTDIGRELQIPAQCQELTDALEKLAGVTGLLEERLVGVLRSDIPKPADESRTKETQINLVPLADELAFFCCKVAHLMEAVNSVIARLEV